MYMSFEYYAPTRVVFGVDAELQTAQLIRRAGGTRVLIVCGGGSAVRSGLLGRIEASLKEQELPFTLLGGVVPNPHLDKVYEGIALGKQIQADFILAVGGGSVIDTAKAIAYGCADDRDVWELFTHRAQAERCLPVGVVLTIAAAGSEMSSGCVITNEKTGEKRAYDDDLCRPAFAVMDPALTLTLPEYQTSSGIADILMHMMERYFNQSENMAVTDAVSEALMRTVMRYARVLMHDPQDLKARAEIMWAGSLAHNGLTGCATGGGDWACHNMEHELGGMFDVAHGAGLAALWGSWARTVCRAAPERFVSFVRNVLGTAPGETQAQIMENGIRAMEDFYREIHMPTNLRELGVAPTDEQIEQMADSCLRACGGTVGCVVPLGREDVTGIYKRARA